MGQVTRREFVRGGAQTTALVALGSLAGGAFPSQATASPLSEQRLNTYRGVVDVLGAGNAMGVDATNADRAVNHLIDRYQNGTVEFRGAVEAALDAVDGLSPSGRFADRGRAERRQLLKTGSETRSSDPSGPSQGPLVLDVVKLAIAPFVPADLRWNIGEVAF